MIITANQHCKYKGWFRLYTTNEYGKITKDTGFFPNLITNQGLDFIGHPVNFNMTAGIPDFTPCCSVGTGNNTPAYTDTNLQAWLVGIYNNGGTGCSTNTFYNAGPPAYWQGQRSWQFSAGTATGNIAEIGVGTCPSGVPNSSSACPCFSRALVVDGSGNPTVIPVLANEALTVTYVLQMYIDLTDTNYTMSLSGTSYSGVFRRAQIDTVGALGTSPTNSVGGNRFTLYTYNGSIQGVTQVPTGVSTFVVASVGSYTNGTYYLPFSCTYSVNQGNFTGGITALMWTNYAVGNWQGSVSPAIPKTTSYAMTLNWNISWARYP